MTTSRHVALEALARIDEGGFANLILSPLLERSGLDQRDRAFVTELVYGTTRMRAACDFIVERFLFRDVDAAVRRALRLGAYQLTFMGMAPHAAVGETVAEVHGPARGLVNAVLRKVASAGTPRWPDDATRLSYPAWIVERMAADLGRKDAIDALVRMNEPPAVTERSDGYIQDRASQDVARALEVARGEAVLDMCAAPGGKATLLAGLGADPVVAADLQPHRVQLIRHNVARLDARGVAPIIADGRHPPFARQSFDCVLVDAPCSGLGVLRRRPDARWRVSEDDVVELAELQRDLLAAAVPLVRVGGMLAYSVCTLTLAETAAVENWLFATEPGLQPLPPPPAPWVASGRGARLLPQAADTDGMYLLRARRVRK